MMRPVAILCAACACLIAQSREPASLPAIILGAARQNALSLTGSLPDYLCTQSIQRFQSPAGTGRWRRIYTGEVRVTYSHGSEEYQVVSTEPLVPSESDASRVSSKGEFGSWLNAIFDPTTRTKYRPVGFETSGGGSSTVFSFRVERVHSEYLLMYGNVGQAVGYHGRLYIDAETDQVVQLEIQAGDIPKTLPVQRSSILITYDFVTIGDRQFFLPRYAEAHVTSGKFDFRTEIDFRDYRKFDAQTAIRFGELGDVKGAGGHAEAESQPHKASASRSARALPAHVRLDEALRTPPAPPEPLPEDRDAWLVDARSDAADLLADLPSFVCSEVFSVSIAVPGKPWKAQGSVRAELRHVGNFAVQSDSIRVESLDPNATRDRGEHLDLIPTAKAAAWSAEFRKLRDNILDPNSRAHFLWDHWSDLRERKTAVYSFSLDAVESRYQSALGPDGSVLQYPVSFGLSGFVYVDLEVHLVTRISAEAVTIPSSAGISGASTIMDFDLVGPASNLRPMPRRTELRIESTKSSARYDSEFQSCTRQ